MILKNKRKQAFFMERWEIIKYFRTATDGDALSQILILQLARVMATFLVAGIWVFFTWLTGFFTVAFVILIGAAIGCVHLLTPKGIQRFNLPSALMLTLFGGIVSNVLAGLALFSSKMGISYWQVLSARRFPEDIQVLSSIFFESFRPQDLFFYIFALMIVAHFAQRNYLCGKNAGEIIEVQVTSGKIYRVGCRAMHYLLSQNKVTKFKRSDGWAVVGKDCLRSQREDNIYTGFERRENEQMIECY